MKKLRHCQPCVGERPCIEYGAVWYATY